jgi:predicted membrane chloride channel (bestrophin family)
MKVRDGRAERRSTLVDFARIIDRQTILVMVTAVVSTFVCLRLGIVVDLPFELVAVAIVFPIVFTINGAFQRRESALGELGELRANLLGIYYLHRDWPKDSAAGHAQRVMGLLREVHRLLPDSLRGRDAVEAHGVHRVFSQLSLSHEALRHDGQLSPSELVCANQYLRSAIENFEKLRNIAVYRTPTSLRAYTQVFLNVFPVLFGPYFALVAEQSSPLIGYVMAMLYSLVLVGLDNIQEGLENPFDGIGIDDVRFDGPPEQIWLEAENGVLAASGSEG